MDFSLIDCASAGNQYPAQLPPTRTVNVHAVMFFDGTLNNERNTRERVSAEVGQPAEAYFRHGQGDTSYANDFTNVALLSQYATTEKSATGEFILSIYVEGIGTTILEADASKGYAFGTGNTGIVAKVQSGLAWLTAALCNVCQKERAWTICVRVDVVGFSRGAAAARHFVHAAMFDQTPDAANRIASESLATRLATRAIKLNRLSFGFVGLFDTVASIGLAGTLEEHSSTSLLNLDAIKHAGAVFQIAAGDEHRVNFALTDITSAGSKGLQLTMPGVHCDIGGSYLDYNTELISILDAGQAPITDWLLNYLKTDLTNWIRDGWFEWADVRHRHLQGGLMPGDSIREAIQRDRKIVVFRAGGEKHGLRNKYGLVALHLMREALEKHGLRFEAEIHDDPATSMNAGCPQIVRDTFAMARRAIASRADKLVLPDHIIKSLRLNFFHISSNYDKQFGVFKPRFVGSRRVRLVHKG